MLKIQRKSAYQLMTEAVLREDQMYVGVLFAQDKSCHVCESISCLSEFLQASSDAIIFYNQSDASQSLVEQCRPQNNQNMIEIFQETQGVFGLRAYSQQGKMMVPQALGYCDD